MKKRENTGRIALGLLLSGIVFITNLGVLRLTLCALYGLVHLGVIETTGGQVGLPDVLKFFFYASLIMGFLLASLTGKITLSPVKRMIDQLERLANGDFKARRRNWNIQRCCAVILSIIFRMSLRRRLFLSLASRNCCAVGISRRNKKKNTLKS